MHRLTACRFLLRRAAVRALSQQSNTLSRSYQPACGRVTSLSQHRCNPIAWRAFHQSRIWRAEEEQKGDLAKKGEASPAENENPAETVMVEPSADEQREIKEESIATPEAADAAAEESTTDTVAEKAEEVASTTAENFSTAAQAGAAAADAATTSAPHRSRPRPQSILPTSTFRNPQPSRILYIGNILFEVNAQQLEAKFKAYGEVTNSRIVTDPRGLSRGFGYVEMATQEEADAAKQALNQADLEGRRMSVQYHMAKQRAADRSDGRRERAPREPSKTLFIGNMSYQMSDRDLNGEPGPRSLSMIAWR